jgi:hypothetical protein
MVIDEIDAVAEAVVRGQLGRVAVGVHRVRLGFRAAREASQVVRRALDPRDAGAPNGRAKPRVGAVGVVALQRWNLVRGFFVHREERRLVSIACTHSINASSADCAAFALGWLIIIATAHRFPARSMT